MRSRLGAGLGALVFLCGIASLPQFAVTAAHAPPQQPGSMPSTAPAGFSDTLIHQLATPTALAWTPDGRMLITQDSGQLRVVRNGQLLTTPALNLAPRMCTNGERGLLGVAVDPQFATNHYVYLYWTLNAHGYCGQEGPNTPHNRVGRYVLGDNDRIASSSERIVVDHLPSMRTIHNAGDLNFGADGFLYVSVGDNGCTLGSTTQCANLNTNSRRLDIPLGKILRVNRSGGVPASNPYVGAAGARRCTQPAGPQPGTGPCTETFASGFRNPFRFAAAPGTNQFYVNDVGQAHWEEIDALVAGEDYGWNIREGHCATGSYTDCGSTPFENPLHDYAHEATGCGSITGGAFVPAGAWPAPYSGSYLFADYVCGKIFRLVSSGGGYSQVDFMSDLGAVVHLEFGPHQGGQALYYLDYGVGAVHRVAYTGANSPPVAHFSQHPDGRAVTLDGSASYDPDAGDSVRAWHWTFGDGSTQTTSAPVAVHTYPATQDYTATLRVEDEQGALSTPFSRQVYAGEHSPTIAITAPATTARFRVGQQVTVNATATDTEDGTLPPGAISWTVRLRHGTHDHPYAGPVTGSSITVTYPAPEDLAATTNSYLVATATATDSRGLTGVVERNLQPRKVTLTFGTSPSGGRVVLNGGSVVTPASVVSWRSYVITVNAPDQSIGGTPHVFSSWSDGGARTHAITTPGTATTYTANFTRSTAGR